MTCRPLQDVLAEVPDPRQAQGRRYPLGAILSLSCAANLCGYRSYSAIAEWGRNYGGDLLCALGFVHGQSPCAATLYHVFRKLNVAAFEQTIGHWFGEVLESWEEAHPGRRAVAIDGKTLRGSKKQGGTGDAPSLGGQPYAGIDPVSRSRR